MVFIQIGYEPEVLEKVLNKIDFVGMDIKNDFDNYDEICAIKIDTDKIKKSVELILNSNVKYEFRTTVYPKYIETKNLENIAKYLKDAGCKHYVLQNYFDHNKTVIPYSAEMLKSMQEDCSKFLPTKLRGII